MFITRLVKDLRYSEISQLAIKDNKEAILSYLNRALVVIYGKYNIKTSETVIELQDNVTEYELPEDYLGLIAAYDEVGREYTINDSDDALGVFTTSYNTLQVPNPVNNAYISIIYASSPEEITYDTETNTYTPNVLKLNIAFYEPLLAYTTYLALNGNGNAPKDESNKFLNRYIALCTELEKTGTINIRKQVNCKLHLRGFK